MDDLVNDNVESGPVRKYPVGFVVKFVILWLLSLPVIAAVALTSDINWTRPYVEQELVDFLKRDVTLGDLTWSFGHDGINIETSSIKIKDLGGSPFLDCKRSQVGVSVLALLQKKLVIKHLDFNSPEVWLVKTGPNRWNFDDLLVEGPEIQLVQVNDGLAHIVDATRDPEWKSPFDLEAIKLNLNWPRKGKKLPFFFAARRDHKKDDKDGNFRSTITVEGLGQGEFATWAKNPYSFKVSARQLDPKEALTLITILREDGKAQADSDIFQVEGLINADLEGEGTFENGLATKIALNIEGLGLRGGNFGHIEAGKTSGSAHVKVSGKRVAWKDFTLKLHGIELKSTGELKEWQAEKSDIAAEVMGHVQDIKDLKFIIDPVKDANKPLMSGIAGQLIAQVNPSRLSGTANLEIKVSGTTEHTSIVTNIDTQKLQFKDIIKDARSQMPLLYIFGITPESKIRGDIRIANQNRIELVNGELTSSTARIKAKGDMDLANSKGKIEIKAESISLKETGINLRVNRKELRKTSDYADTSEKYDLKLDGTATADATIMTNGDNFKLTGLVNLINASMYLGANGLKLSGVNGRIDLDGNNRGGSLKISGINGNMGEGKFEVEGSATFSNRPDLNIALHATSFDLRHLSGLVDLFRIEVPILAERYLYGSVKDVRMKITGTPVEPRVFFSAVPDNLYYKPPGMDKPLRATSGLIVFAEDQLVMRDVDLITGDNQITVTVSIENVSKEARIARVKAKTEGVELAELHYYLSSALMPPPIRKAYQQILDTYKISGPYGKAYGDILCLMRPDGDVVLDGIIGFFKVGAGVFDLPVSDLAGMIAISGADLMLKDLHGSINKSSFSVDGIIKSYRSKDPVWQTEMKARLTPRDFERVLAVIKDRVDTGGVTIKSKGPLSIRAKLNGDKTRNDLKFSLASDRENGLVIASPYGSISQPAGLPLTIDASIKARKPEVKIEDMQLLMADTMMSLKGKLLFDKTRNRLQKIDLTFAVPQEASLKTLIEMIRPELASGMKGTIQGSLTARGEVTRPLLSGKMHLYRVHAPALAIEGLDGIIEGHENTDDPAVLTSARVLLEDAKIKNLVLRNLGAEIDLLPGKDRGKRGRLVINKGNATLAGGQLDFNGWMDMDEHSYFLKASTHDVSARKLSEKLLGNPSEITGDSESSIELKTSGTSREELVENLEGWGHIEVHDGVVGRFGTLQTRLTQYNLLTQGIFGFNLNNLVQSVWPVRTGEFSELRNDFSIQKGVIRISELRFEGDDMRLWGVGEANLPENVISLDIAGKIPRVTKSMLGGTVGDVSRSFTLQRAFKIVTFGKLENLPALPVIGAIATDKPRTFTFKVDAPLDQPKVLAKSIEKNFKWLPNRPTATAHPVPGITQ
ncbi:MAG: AsmA family protein [Candidatus Melainabacteria bacterium]|nr:AsmA family protein [Candidatus Melainabacteria bacterium]